jgi:hypothetical protein
MIQKSDDVYPVYPVEGKAIQIRSKKRFDWSSIISLLLEGKEIFMEIDRRQAYYVRRKLEKKLDTMVEGYPSYMNGMEGYMFRMSIVKDFLRRRIHESANSEEDRGDEG